LDAPLPVLPASLQHLKGVESIRHKISTVLSLVL
jgi:hypothetical protein